MTHPTEWEKPVIVTDRADRRVWKFHDSFSAEDEALLWNVEIGAGSRLEAIATLDGYAKEADSYVSVFLRLPLPEGCRASYAMHHIGYLR